MSTTATRCTILAAFPPNASVSVCSPGTTTKITLYATSAGTTALANPVIADAWGGVTFFPATYGTLDLVLDEQGTERRLTFAVGPTVTLAWPG